MQRGVMIPVLVLFLAGGCVAPGERPFEDTPTAVAASFAKQPTAEQPDRAVVLAAHQEKRPDPARPPASFAAPAESPFAGRAELAAPDLIPAVLSRNPTVEQMAAAAAAAAA